MTEAEERALLWQTNQRKKSAFARSLQALLRAPREPAATTKKNWNPVRRRQ